MINLKGSVLLINQSCQFVLVAIWLVQILGKLKDENKEVITVAV
jgi:hypothetical protein